MEFRRERDNKTSDSSQDFDRILSALTDPSQIPSSKIADAVAQGHPLAVAAINEAASNIGIAIGSLITIMNPPTVILGGNMVQSIPSFFTKTVEAAKRFTWSIAWSKTRLLKGELEEPQLWGAAHLAGEKGLS
jgi:predicted NBD/HSP70 family sugar kinase